MKAAFTLALALALPAPLRPQGVPAIILLDPITVGSINILSLSVRPLLQTQIDNQQRQIDAATTLNRSLGYWGNDVPAARSDRLAAGPLSREHTAPLRTGVTWDGRATLPAAPRTLAGTAVTVPAEDYAAQTRVDELGAATRDTLGALATEMAATQREVAATYAAMTAHGQTQQKYEKLRGRLQALQLHLENLQAQQHAALSLLQAQATASAARHTRDGELAARIQEANHRENVAALSALQFDALRWR